MKKINRFIIAFGIMLIIAPMLLNVYAALPGGKGGPVVMDDGGSDPNAPTTTTTTGNAKSSQSLNDIISKANDFFKNSIKNGVSGDDTGLLDFTDVFNTIIDAIFVIGNLIIICAAAIMGLRYVWSGVAEKASIKESAINMSVGVVFFYMAKGIKDFFFGIAEGIFTADSFDTMQTSIWTMVAYSVKILAVIGLAATGLKYMFESADTKADLKKKLFPVIVGLVIVFCLTDVIGFITKATTEVLGVDNNTVNSVGTPGYDDSNIKDVRGVIDRIWGTAKVIIQILAVAVIVGTGVRYMFMSADQRADIKRQTVILLAGAAIVFGTTEIITFVQKVGSDILK